MNEYEHQRFRDWEVSCAQKDAAIIQLTAERDALKSELVALDACSTRDINALAEVQAENEQLRLELAAANRAVGNNVRENERLRAELARTPEIAQAAATLQRNVDTVAHDMVIKQRDDARENAKQLDAAYEETNTRLNMSRVNRVRIEAQLTELREAVIVFRAIAIQHAGALMYTATWRDLDAVLAK